MNSFDSLNETTFFFMLTARKHPRAKLSAAQLPPGPIHHAPVLVISGVAVIGRSPSRRSQPGAKSGRKLDA